MARTQVQEDGCWLWIGPRFTQGYGLFTFHRKNRRAHRVLYVWTHGELPGDLVLDHACNNRLCVRPHPCHVRASSQKDNALRAPDSSITACNARKTHCKRGHEFTPENTDTRYGKRVCVECRRVAARERYRATHPNAVHRGPYKRLELK